MSDVKICCVCDERVDDDYGWSNVTNEVLCEGCQNQDFSSASKVSVVYKGKTEVFYIGDHIRFNEHGDDMYDPDLWKLWDLRFKFDRVWKSTDGMRGHYDTTIEGWESVMEGWTTGGWDDPVAQKKQIFNQWAERLLAGEIDYEMPIAIVADPTSNVFSMGISVLTPKKKELEEVLEYTGDYFLLKNSLS